jgi:2,5-diketo-D-gluconate reductase A
MHSHAAALALRLGGRGVDNALIYRDQRKVAAAIKESKIPRKELFLTSKIPGYLGPRLTKKFVQEDLDELQMSYFDLLLIHFDHGTDLAGTWATLEELHANGTLRAIGVSNFQKDRLQELIKIAKVPIAVNQCQHNVFERDVETEKFCVEQGITYEAYSPLGRNATKMFTDPTLKTIAARHNVSNAQVGLKWILQHGHILTFQSTSEAHQRNDADLFSFNLSGEEMSTIDSLSSPSILV